MTPFMMGTTSCITMQNLGKIVQRAPAVYMCENVVFVFFCFFFVFFVVFFCHA